MERSKNIDGLLAELSVIVDKMEGEATSVTEALEMFERGVMLSEECFKVLNSYKGKVTVLSDKLDKLHEASDE